MDPYFSCLSLLIGKTFFFYSEKRICIKNGVATYFILFYFKGKQNKK